MKKVLSAVIVTFCICSAVMAAPIFTADDFTPPVQAPEEQREDLLTVQSPDAVTTENDPATNKPVTRGLSVQDAINAIVSSQIKGGGEGCEMIATPEGGYGFVATGKGSYRKDMKNLTALRIAQRNAYVQGFMQAKNKMAGAVSGIAISGKTNFDSQTAAENTDTSSTSTTEISSAESIRASTAAVLKGFVTYNVYDDFEKGDVYVTIVSTPKTRGKFSRVTNDTISAESINAGLNAVLSEIQSGLSPLVGGRIVEDPVTGEIAFVGFGSAVVRQTKNQAMRSQMRRVAQNSAGLRAADALCGIITGDTTRGESKFDEQTRESKISYENAEKSDPMNTLATSEDVAEAERMQNEFRNSMQSTETIESARRGVIPPGVIQRAWLDNEGVFAYAIAIYRPSLTKAASSAAKEMRETQIVQPYGEPESTAPGSSEQGSNPAYKDSGIFKRNSTGTVNQPL